VSDEFLDLWNAIPIQPLRLKKVPSKIFPADVLKRIDEALEDIDNGIFLTDGIPSDEALRRWQDVAANTRMEKDDES